MMFVTDDGVSGFEIACFPSSLGSQAAQLFNRRWEKEPGRDEMRDWGYVCYFIER